MPALRLQPAPWSAPWPIELPDQTELQDHLHERHWTSRLRIMAALARSFYPKHRSAARAIAYCGHDAHIEIPDGDGEASFKLDRCRHRMCPFCAAARSAHVAHQIRAAMRTYQHPRAIVLTQRSEELPLRRAIDLLRNRFARLRKTLFWKRRVVAGVYTLEVTRNEDTGLWHPHLHIVYAGAFIPQQELSELWQKITAGSPVVSISEVRDKGSVSYELAKYIGKPQQVAGWPDHAILEYATATKTCRMIGLFGKQPGQRVDNQDPGPGPSRTVTQVSLRWLTHMAENGSHNALAALRYASGLFPLVANWTAKHFPQVDLERPADTDEEAHAFSGCLARELRALIADGPPPPPDG